MTRITKIDTTSVDGSKKRRVAAYARVSTSNDEQLLSLEAQKEYYENYIKSNPAWEFAGLYYDEGISGTKISKREQLLQLLEDCEAGKIDRVISKSISRFARNTTDCLEMVRRLTKMNISIFFEKENIDTEHMSSELMLAILSAIAESESRSISENCKWSIRHRFENGTFIISCPPYGYKNVDGKMVVVPDEAEVVKDIFDMSINGMGSHRIAAELNKRGIRTKRKGKWQASAVQAILKNEKYTGDVIYQKTFTDESFNRHVNYGEKNRYLHSNHHEAIVSHEVFKKSGEEIARRGRERGIESESKKYQNRYCFSGKLICGCCGAILKRRIHYRPYGDYVTWNCKTHLEDKNSCGLKYVEEEHIKCAFIRMMTKLNVGKSLILKPFINNLRGYDNKEKLHQILELESRLDKNSEQQTILVELMASGYLQPDIFCKEKQELDIRMDALTREKELISGTINGNLKHLNEAQKLQRLVSGAKAFTVFDEETFNLVVDTVTILSREAVCFNLRCGLRLEERMVKNEIYLGTNYYPKLIDDETFLKVQELRTSVGGKERSIREHKPKKIAPMNLNFEVGAVHQKFQDPYEQARFAYTQIKEA